MSSVHAGLATTVVAVVRQHAVSVRQHAVSVRATGLTQTSLGAGSRRGAGAGVVVSPLRASVLMAKFAGG